MSQYVDVRTKKDSNKRKKSRLKKKRMKNKLIEKLVASDSGEPGIEKAEI